MTSTVDLEVLDKCTMALVLRDVNLYEVNPTDRTRKTLSEGNTAFRRALEAYPMRFSFQDGSIEHVCPDSSEIDKPWVINLKRGVLSSFQNTMDDLMVDTKLKEHDVTGKCQAEYKVSNKAWTQFTIKKKKDLMSCTDRHGFRTSLQSTPYRVQSDIQSLPLIKGTHECIQTIHKSGYLLKSECTETHMFRPFSKGDNGAVTKATHVLEFRTERQGVRTTLRGRSERRSMLFEHEKRVDEQRREILGATNMLREICQNAHTDIRPDTPSLYSTLVYKLRSLSQDSLKEVHRMVSSNAVCSSNHKIAKKFFHDAIPMVNSEASVSLISSQVTNGHISDNEADMWVTSLAFVQSPNKGMIASVGRLLDGQPRKSSFLAVSAMVNNYCKDRRDCHEEPEVGRIISTIERRIGSSCKYNSIRDRDYVLMALRAAGNLGLSPSLARRLNGCMRDAENPIDIRLEAIKAYRRMSCSIDNTHLIDMFTNKQTDTELRIAAYEALMKCASPELLETIKRTLAREEVNQVASYVWSHLSNLLKTNDVHKQNIRKILDEADLKKSFDMDRRKFSRNYEASYFSDMANTGVKAESNLVFSPKSFVPRSANLNLTLDLFGDSVNLLEVGGRVEGLEEMVEKLFGPTGYFDNSIKDTVQRTRRSINDINRLHEQYRNGQQRELKGNMYFRIFGHELSYVDLVRNGAGGSNFNILELLISLAKDHDIDITKSFMFLDTTMTVPLMTGMPLKLSVNGTATVNIKINGKLDVRKLGASPRSLDISGYIKPSGAVEVSSLMGVDAFVTRTGLKMTTTLHSSTEVDGLITLKDSQIANIKFNVPKDKIEILNAESKFYIIHREVEREQSMLAREPIRKKSCTPASTTKLFGMEICSETSYPNYGNELEASRYALAGPHKLMVQMNKRDSHTAYEFEAKLLTRKYRKEGITVYAHEAKLAFDTPNSRVNRKLLFDFNLNRGDKALNFELLSPWKKVALNGAILNNENHKRLTGRLLIDEEREYSITSEVQINTKTGRRTITPNVEIRMHNRNTISLSGQIDHTLHQSLNADLTVKNLFSEDVNVKAELTKQNRGRGSTRYDMSTEFHSQIFHTKVTGYLDARKDRYASRIEVDYGKQRKPEHRLVLNYKMRDRKSVTYRRVIADTAIESSQFPDLNFQTRVDLQKTTTGHYEGEVSLSYGRNPNDHTKKINVNALLKISKDQDGQKIESSAAFKYPVIEADFATKLTAHHKPSQTKANAVIQWATGKQLTTDVTYRKNDDTHTLNGAMTLPEKQPISFSGSVNLDLKNIQLAGQVNYEGRLHTADIGYVGDASVNHDLTANLQLPGKPLMKLKAVGKFDPKDFVADVKVHHDNKEYASKVVYTLEKTNDVPVLTGSIDLKHPERRIITDLTFQVSRWYSMIKVLAKWDADRDESKAVEIEINPRAEINQDFVDFHIKFPGRMIKGKGKFVRHYGDHGMCHVRGGASIEWEEGKKADLVMHFKNKPDDSGREISGMLSFKSPFEKARDVSGRFSLNKEGITYRGNAEASYNEKKINADVIISAHSVKNFEIKLAASTPYEQFKDMGAHFKNVITDQTMLSSKLAIMAGAKSVDLEVDGKLSPLKELTIKIMTPFENFKKMIMKMSQAEEERTYKHKFTFLLSPHIKETLITFDLNPTSIKDFSAKLSVSSEYEIITTANLELVGKYHYDGPHAMDIRTTLGGDINNLATKFGFTVTNDGHPGENVIHAEVFGKCKHFDSKLEIFHKDNKPQYSTSADLTHNGKKMVTVAVNMNHNRNVEIFENNGDLKIITPYKFNVDSTWRMKLEDGKWSSQEDVTVNGKTYTFVIDGEHVLSYGTRRIVGSLSVMTPTYPRGSQLIQKLHYVHNTNGDVESKLLFFEGVNKIGGIEYNLKFDGSRWNIDSSLDVDVLSMFSLRANPFKSKLKTHLSGYPYTTTFDIIQTNGGKHLLIDFTHEKRGYRQFFTRAVLETPSKYMRKLEVENSFQASEQYKGNTKLDYKGDAYQFNINADSSWTSRANNLVHYKFTSNIPQYENMVYKIEQSYLSNRYQLEKEIRFGPYVQLISTYHILFDKYRPSSSWLATLNGHQIKIIGNGIYNHPLYQGDVKFELTPKDRSMTTLDSNFKIMLDESQEFHAKLDFKCHNYKNIEIVLDHDARGDRYQTTWTTKVQEIGEYATTSIIKKSFEFFKLTTRTPHQKFKSAELQVEVDNENPLKGTKLTGEVIFDGGKKMEVVGLVDVESRRDFNLQFTAKSPYRNYEASLTHKDVEGRCDTTLVLDKAGSKLKYNSVYQAKNPFIFKIELKTPVQFISSMLIDINNDYRSYSDFKHKFVFEYNVFVSRVRFENEWEVKGAELVKGGLRLTSPISGYEFLIFHVDHRKQGQELLTDVEFNRVSRHRLQIRQILNIEEQKYELEVNTPWSNFRRIKVRGNRNGSGKNYVSHVEIELPRYKLTHDMTRRPKSVSSDVKITTPHDGYEEINHNVKLEWATDYVKAETKSTVGNKMIQGDLMYRGKRDMELTINSGAYRFKAKYNRQSNAVLDVEIKSPRPSLRLLKINAEHSNEIKNKIELTFRNDRTQAAINSDWTLKDGFKTINGQTTFTSNIMYFDKLKYSLDYKNRLNAGEMNVNSIFEKNADIYNVVMDYKKGAQNKATLNIRSPHEILKTLSIDSTYNSIDAKPFTSKLMVNYNDMPTPIVLEISYGNPILNFGFSFSGPIFKRTEIVLNYRNPDKQSYGGQTKFVWGTRSYDLELNTQVYSIESITGSARLRTSEESWEDTKLEFSHRGSIESFVTDMKLISRRHGESNAKIEWSTRPQYSGKVVVLTPFEGWNRLEAVLNHQGDEQEFTTTLNGAKDGKRFSGTFTFKNTDGVEASVIITTPIAGYNRMSGSLTYKTPLELKINLRTQIEKFEKLEFVLGHNGDAENFNSNAVVQYMTGKRIEAKLTYKKGYTSYDIDLTMKTPFSSAPNPRFVFYYEGGYGNIDTKLQLLSGTNSALLNTHLKARNYIDRIDGLFILRTPFKVLQRIEVKASALHQLDGSFSVHHAAGKTSGSLHFKINEMDGYVFRGVFDTPYDVSGHLTTSRSNGYMDFALSSHLQWAAGRRVEFRKDLRRMSPNGQVAFVSKTSLSTPFKYIELLSLEVRFSGDAEDFTSNIVGEYGKNGHKVYLDVQNKKFENGIITLKTPFEHAKSLSLKYQKMLVDQKNGYHIEAQWAYGKAIGFDYGWRHSGTLPELSVDCYFKVTTPFEQARTIVLDIDHMHTPSMFDNKLAITYNTRRYDTSSKYDWTATSIKGETNIRSPTPMRMTITLQKAGKDVTGNAMFSWDTRSFNKNAQVNLVYSDGSNYFTNKKDLLLKVTLPWRTMGIETKLEKTSYKTIQSTTFTIDEKKNLKGSYELILNDKSRTYLSKIDGSFTLVTPIRTIKTTFDHQKSNTKHEDTLEIMWDAARDMGRKISIQNVMETKGKTRSMQVTVNHPRLTKPITLSGELTLHDGSKLVDFRTKLDHSTDPRDMLMTYISINSEAAGLFAYTTRIGYKHARSNSDHRIKITTIDTDARLEGGVEVKYVGQIAEMRMEIDRIRKTMLMKVPVFKPHLTHMIMNGNMEENTNGYKIDVTNKYGVNEISAEIDVNTKIPSIDLRFNHDSENKDNLLHLYGRYLSHKDLKIEAYRLQNGERITDGLVSLYLNTSRLLHTRLHWRPEFYKDAKEYASTKLAAFRDRASELYDQQRVRFDRFKVSRGEQIKASLPDTRQLQAYVNNEVESFKRDYERIRTTWIEMMDKNEFFLQDISEVWTRVSAYIQHQAEIAGFRLRRTVEHLQKVYMQRWTSFRRKWEHKMNNLQDTIADFVLNFRPTWQKCVYSMISSYNLATQKITHGFEEMMEKIDDWKEQAVDYFDDQFDFISLRMEPFWLRLKEWRRNLRSSIESLDDEGFLKKVTDFFKKHQERIDKWAEGINEKYAEIIEEIEEKIDEQMEVILGHRLTQMVIAKSKELTEEAKRLWKEYEVEENLQELLDTSIATGKKILRSQLNDIAKSFLLLDKSGFTVWDPKNGEIQAEIYLPTRIKQLNKLPEFNLNQLKAELNKLYRKYIPKTDYNIWDYFYMYRPSADVRNWLPPFKGYASILGNSHFVTFDHKIYDFVGSCSYMLTHDFVYKTMSLIVNYEGGKRKSLTVISNDKQIEIFPDYKVTIDGHQTEVPIQFKNTSVIRTGSEIRVHNEKGFTVTCNMVTELCRFNVSGWYYGKMAGLLGTYTNEMADDFTKPDHTVTDDVDEFARSWQIGSYCRPTRTFAIQPLQTGAAAEKCKTILEAETSQFRHCFKIIPPKKYLEMCLKDISAVYNDDVINDKICSVSSLYVTNCKMHGVPIRRPKFCTKCQSPSSALMIEGEKVKIKSSELPSTRSADVVFVVEEKKCNKELAQKIPDLAMQINNALGATGKSDNRFGLVGFGGDKVHDWEQVHSMENQIFNDVRKVRMAAETLDFTKDGSNDDILRAVRYAAKYPYRPGVAKVVIAIPCSACIPKSAKYSEMLTLLNERDVVFHILMDHEFQFKSSSPKSSYIFGADRNAVYTNKDVHSTSLKGDSSLLRQIVAPKDICVELVHQRKGSVFNVKKMLEGRVNSQKYFLDVFARRIAKTAVASECQICDCTTDITGAGQTVCRPCELPSQRFKYFSGAYERLFGHQGERPVYLPAPDPLNAPPEIRYEEYSMVRQRS